MNIVLVTDAQGLAACHSLRREVFMGEQGVSAIDEWDGLDGDCLHFLAADSNGPAATLRLRPLGRVMKIQRVAVARRHRGTGLGQRVMQAALDHARSVGILSVELEAQTHALGFYERFGFLAEGPEFDDAGIPHKRMVLHFPCVE